MQGKNDRLKKTKRNAQASAFGCLLIYFTVKAFVVLILATYDNYLQQNPYKLAYFCLCLFTNAYLMLTVGKDPGFVQTKKAVSDADGDQCQLVLKEERTELGPAKKCQICQCFARNRMKHCYKCGRCVMKYDHHCPWIGGCVGQYNHGKFWVSLVGHSLQAGSTFYIFMTSLGIYQYVNKDGSYGQEFGIFCIMSFFMFIYFVFAIGLLSFHSYLIAMNITTSELMKGSQLEYLKGVKGNPYDKGVIRNIIETFSVVKGGRQWLIQQNEPRSNCLQFVANNQYYSCC